MKLSLLFVPPFGGGMEINMKKCNYALKQFIMVEVTDGYAIQNELSFTVLKDKNMISFFKMLDDENRLIVSSQLIERYFGDETDEAIMFLTNSKLISQTPVKQPYEKTIVYTNDSVIFESIEFNKTGMEEAFYVNYSQDCKAEIEKLNAATIDSDSLYFVILNPFDYKDFLNISDKLRSLNVYIVICFAYNSMFYMTNLYKKEWYNPCPKCFFSQLETSLRSKAKNTTHSTFQTIVDLIYNKDVSFKVCLPTNRSNVMPLILEVLHFKNNDFDYLSNRVAKVNLVGDVYYDQCNHWELCDCFE